MTQAGWSDRLANVVAAEVRRYREAIGMSGQRLVERCRELGLDITRSTLGDFESGRRVKVTVAELVIFARALEISPLQLVVPVGRQETIELFPGVERPVWDAARWFTGELSVWDLENLPEPAELPGFLGNVDPVLPLPAFRRHDALLGAWQHQRSVVPPPVGDTDPELASKMLEITVAQTRQLEIDISHLRREMRRQGLIPPPLPPDLAHVDQPRKSGTVREAREYRKR